MTDKKILFIGSRFNVLEQLLECETISNIKIYALAESLLEKILKGRQIPFNSFSTENRKSFMEYLLQLDFDILISNGCPIIFPVQKFKEHQILINVHPTYLPYLQGKTPLNGVFYSKYDFYGATMHYIDKGIDTGDIIFQKKHNLTSDIDLGLLYHLAMKLEGTVFKHGWNMLKEANFNYIGKKQEGEASYFNREPSMQIIDFKTQKTDDLLVAIKSFGIETQGVFSTINDIKYKIIEAEKIIHEPLLLMHSNVQPGNIILNYDQKLLVKTIDGIIKINRFSILS